MGVATAPQAAHAQGPDGAVGPSGADQGLYTNGRFIRPVGRQTRLGNFPTGGALSPDGRFYWTVSAGHGVNDVRIVEVATGQVTQVLPLPGAYVGVTFSPSGARAYVSGQKRGCCGPQGTTVGDAGDVIHVYGVNPATGAANELAPIQIPATSGGSYRTNTFPPEPNANNWPVELDVTPDGQTLLAALGNSNRLAIIDLSDNSVTFASVGSYPYGVEVDPARPRAYVTNEYAGTVSVVEIPSGTVTATIGVGGPDGDQGSHPEGMLADPRRDRLYVAVASRDLIAVLDTSSLQVLRHVDVGRPEGLGTGPVDLAISPDGQTLYSANSNEDAVAAIALADRPTGSQVPQKKAVSVPPTIGAINAYGAAARKARKKRDAAIRSGSPATGQAARRRFRARLAALRASLLTPGSTSSCEGPSQAQVSAYTSSVLAAQKRLRRALRAARKLKGRARARARLLARDRYAGAVKAAQDALPATFCPEEGFIAGAKAFDVLGRLPTAAYATDVEITPDGSKLVWLSAKGLGAGPNPEYGTPFSNSNAAPYGSYVPQKLLGRAGILDRPTDKQMQTYLGDVDRQITPTNAKPPPPNTPLLGANGGPSDKIKHIFYVVRENRTYDQVFGSDPRGDGDPSLEVLSDNGVPGPSGGITPNAHALSRAFPLLDHVYANSEVSIDGHMITAGAYAIDYAQKGLHSSYSGRGKGSDVGIFPVSFPPRAFVFDQAVREGVSFRSYGELGAGNQPFGNDGRPTFAQVLANTDFIYPTNLQQGCIASLPPPNLIRCFQDSGIVNGRGQITGVQSRIEVFEAEFAAQLATDTVPSFNYLILPNDHTSGSAPGIYSPEAMIADNDLALGQLVELISQSEIWDESAIMVVEDDSQDGADSVDAHRMPAFVISPWAKRGGSVVTSRFDQYSFLRTAMMTLGLEPVSLNDAKATPLYDAFISGSEQPDVEGTRYTAIVPEQSLTEVNPAAAPNAALSAAMPWDHLDYVPQKISDRIIWQSVYGANSTPPAPGPNASAAERARAIGALRIFRRGGDARSWLLSHPESESKTAEREELLRASALAAQLGISVEEAEERIEEAEEVE